VEEKQQFNYLVGIKKRTLPYIVSFIHNFFLMVATLLSSAGVPYYNMG
jgi:hypothetical protein